MNARVVTANVQTDRVDEAVSRYRDAVVPAAKQQKGYRGRLLFVNYDTGKALSITLWDTETDMIAGEDSAYLQTQFSSFRGLFTEPPIKEHYRVSVNTHTAMKQSSP